MADPSLSLPLRLRSLDALRGATIAGMILVNTPGSWNHVFPALRHADWHGWTPTDLVFPFFLFILGVAIPCSLGRRQAAGEPRGRLFRRVLRRSAVLIALGLLLAAYPHFDLATLRLPGVLQRIGVVYLVTGAAFLLVGRRGLVALALSCLVGYQALMRFVPPPGGVAGDLEPGTNLAAFVDRALLGANLYQGSWDPEGVLSTIPAVATALVGVFAGQWLRAGRPPAETTTGLFAAGFGLLTLGWAWGFWFPINKNLWTSSYVLFTGGIALSCLAAFVLALDSRPRAPRWTRPWARPLEALGRNAIGVFVASGLLVQTLFLLRVAETSAYTWLWRAGFASWLGPLPGSLAFALAHVAVWTAVAVILDRRQLWLRV